MKTLKNIFLRETPGQWIIVSFSCTTFYIVSSFEYECVLVVHAWCMHSEVLERYLVNKRLYWLALALTWDLKEQVYFLVEKCHPSFLMLFSGYGLFNVESVLCLGCVRVVGEDNGYVMSSSLLVKCQVTIAKYVCEICCNTIGLVWSSCQFIFMKFRNTHNSCKMINRVAYILCFQFSFSGTWCWFISLKCNNDNVDETVATGNTFVSNRP